MRQGKVTLQKNVQHLLPAGRVAQVVVLKYVLDGQLHNVRLGTTQNARQSYHFLGK
jgi:hypothetical protein